MYSAVSAKNGSDLRMFPISEHNNSSRYECMPMNSYKVETHENQTLDPMIACLALYLKTTDDTCN